MRVILQDDAPREGDGPDYFVMVDLTPELARTCLRRIERLSAERAEDPDLFVAGFHLQTAAFSVFEDSTELEGLIEEGTGDPFCEDGLTYFYDYEGHADYFLPAAGAEVPEALFAEIAARRMFVGEGGVRFKAELKLDNSVRFSSLTLPRELLERAAREGAATVSA